MEQAPLFDDIADGPEGGVAHWLKTDDGLKIRVGSWPVATAKGTVLLFPGRTEYVEKYGRAARDFHARGYAMLAVDWRGQGLADRMTEDATKGHVGKFTDYQHDVDATIDHARALGLPEPYYLVAHSMGGGIGLRSLIENMPVKAAAFSGPMWGIAMADLMRPVAWALPRLARPFGLLDLRAPLTENEPTELS